MRFLIYPALLLSFAGGVLAGRLLWSEDEAWRGGNGAEHACSFAPLDNVVDGLSFCLRSARRQDDGTTLLHLQLEWVGPPGWEMRPEVPIRIFFLDQRNIQIGGPLRERLAITEEFLTCDSKALDWSLVIPVPKRTYAVVCQMGMSRLGTGIVKLIK
jgi:hypothetical protein